jgi:hypothetical protein
MLCEQCGKVPASYQLTILIEGKPVRRDLCPKCHEAGPGAPRPLPRVAFVRPSITVGVLAARMEEKTEDLIAALAGDGVNYGPNSRLTLIQAEELGKRFGVAVVNMG